MKMKTGDHSIHRAYCPKSEEHEGVELVRKKVEISVRTAKNCSQFFRTSVPGDGYPHYLVCSICGTELVETGKDSKPSEEMIVEYTTKKKKTGNWSKRKVKVDKKGLLSAES